MAATIGRRCRPARARQLARAGSTRAGSCAPAPSVRSLRCGVVMVLADLDIIEHAERVFRHAPRASSRARSGRRRCAALVDAHEAHRQARATLRRGRPAGTGRRRPASSRRCAATGSSTCLPSVSGTLSDGTSGRPRQVRNGEPNSVTVGGGTPRRVHSRPNAAMARGCARKNAGSFHTLAISSSRSSGVGAPERVEMRIDGAALASRP